MHGGVYADIKTIFLTHLDNIFPSADHYRWYVVMCYTGNCVYNGVFATPPRNPMLLELIEHCTHNFPTRYHDYVNHFLRVLKKRYNIKHANERVYTDKSSSVYIYHERCKSDDAFSSEKECSLVKKRDRYNFCCNIYGEGENPVISVRDPDYPW